MTTALKSETDVRTDPFGLFSSFSFQNFVAAWTDGRFGDFLWNSVLLSVPTTVVVVVLSTAAAYAFARCPFPGRSIAFYAVVMGLLVPFFTFMIPLYFQLRDIGLLAITSADRLYQDWHRSRQQRRQLGAGKASHIERLLSVLPAHCGFVTVIDGHPSALAWIGSVRGHREKQVFHGAYVPATALGP